MTISTGSTFTVGGSSGNYTQTGGTTTVDGTLAGTGSANLDLTGGKLYGTGSVNDAVTDAATVTPGNSATSTGKLEVNGTYAQSAGGALDVTLGGTTAGTNYDQLNVSSTASLGGTLNVTLAAGYKPAVGNTFDILNASLISGNFTTINLPTLTRGTFHGDDGGDRRAGVDGGERGGAGIECEPDGVAARGRDERAVWTGSVLRAWSVGTHRDGSRSTGRDSGIGAGRGAGIVGAEGMAAAGRCRIAGSSDGCGGSGCAGIAGDVGGIGAGLQ